MRILPFLALLALTLGSQPNITLDKYVDSSNTLWTGLFRDCKAFPTMQCVQKNAFHYLDDTLKQKDVSVGQFLKFTPNTVDYTKYSKEANENEMEEEPRSEHPLGEVTDALSNKAVRFLMTHDAQFKIPFVLDGAYLKVAPRSFEDDGILVKLDIMHPQQPAERRSGEEQPRILNSIVSSILSKSHI